MTSLGNKTEPTIEEPITCPTIGDEKTGKEREKFATKMSYSEQKNYDTAIKRYGDKDRPCRSQGERARPIPQGRHFGLSSSTEFYIQPPPVMAAITILAVLVPAQMTLDQALPTAGTVPIIPLASDSTISTRIGRKHRKNDWPSLLP